MKSRIVAAVLAFFCGWIGIHKFYLGQNGAGILYLLFFWTTIPFFISFVESIMFLVMSDQEFDARYNKILPANPTQAHHSSEDIASKLDKLYTLKERGAISDEEYQKEKAKII